MTVRSFYRHLPSLHRRRLGALGLLLAVAVAAGAGPVAAQSDEDIIEDRKARREETLQAAQAASEGLDAATAEADDLIDALNKAQAASERPADRPG